MSASTARVSAYDRRRQTRLSRVSVALPSPVEAGRIAQPLMIEPLDLEHEIENSAPFSFGALHLQRRLEALVGDDDLLLFTHNLKDTGERGFAWSGDIVLLTTSRVVRAQLLEVSLSAPGEDQPPPSTVSVSAWSRRCLRGLSLPCTDDGSRNSDRAWQLAPPKEPAWNIAVELDYGSFGVIEIAPKRRDARRLMELLPQLLEDLSAPD